MRRVGVIEGSTGISKILHDGVEVLTRCCQLFLNFSLLLLPLLDTLFSLLFTKVSTFETALMNNPLILNRILDVAANTRAELLNLN